MKTSLTIRNLATYFTSDTFRKQTGGFYRMMRLQYLYQRDRSARHARWLANTLLNKVA